MLSELLVASVLQVGPFWQKGPEDFHAIRPFWSRQGETTDVLWPVFTSHRDWWRFCFFVHEQWELDSEAYQFQIMPLYWQGRTREPESGYWGLFPFYGTHPHALLMYDWQFALFPVWMRYRFPRGAGWVEKNSVLWPIVSWRDDGSWAVFPLYGRTYQRESRHQYALWPLVTWADYARDRDTAGEGTSWMVWPLWAQVRRERERQTMFLPPLFSLTETRSPAWEAAGNSSPEIRLRCPWPLFEYESGVRRNRLSIFPIYEHVTLKDYRNGETRRETTRWFWKLIELYPDETRVFPFWTSRDDGSYFRLWPFYERTKVSDKAETSTTRVLALFPIRWSDSIDRNWAKFWTFYENVRTPDHTDHSLFWGIIRWRSSND